MRAQGKQLLLRSAGWLLAAAVALGAATCQKQIQIQPDPSFSVNLVVPPALWPKTNLMTPAESEAYEEYGRPDYFRIWYNPQGEISSAREAGPAMRTRSVGRLPRSWVYEAQKIEIIFRSPGRFEKTILSEQLQLLCRRGDPSARDVDMRNGMVRESWTYYDVGEKYTFLDGKLVGKQVLPPLGKPFARK